MSILNKKPNPNKVDTLIGPKTVFEGKLIACGGIRVDGTVKGTIECEGVLVVGKEGKIEANVIAGSAIIGGEMVGNITTKKRLEITANGKVIGDITTPHLIIDDGVIFEGSSHMVTEEMTSNYPLDKKNDSSPEGSPQEDEK